MKITTFTLLIMLCMSGISFINAQDVGGPAIEAVEVETEAEAEVEVEAGEGQVSAAVALAAASAATSPFSSVLNAVSAAISTNTQDPAQKKAFISNFSEGGIQPSSPNPGVDILGFGEAEAESEVEVEVEVEVNNGAAVAAGGATYSLGAAGRGLYTATDGNYYLYPSDIALAGDARTSSSTSTSPVLVSLPRPVAEGNDYSDPPIFETPDTEVNDPPPGGGNQLYADSTVVPFIQFDIEAEVEAEAEAEAEAETQYGAAAASASGGGAAASVGDYSRADSRVSVATSTVTDPVTVLVPFDLPFYNAPQGNPDYSSSDNGSGSNSPTTSNGKGLFEAESEAEVEAEAEAEVDNNAAAASAVAVGSGGSNGIGATAKVATATSASTSTQNSIGQLQRRNDEVIVRGDTYDSYDVGLNFASAEAEAEAEADVDTVFAASASATPTATGDAATGASIAITGKDSAIPTANKVTGPQYYEYRSDKPRSYAKANKNNNRSSGNFEEEDEAEAEAEAEAEVGYNAAAASAAAGGTQAKNSIFPIYADAAASTATSTKVWDGMENVQTEVYDEGPSEPGDIGDYPQGPFDYDDFIAEVETEAEAEAEVGFQAAAIAAAAAGVGYDNIKTETKYAINEYAAAVAAGAGANVELTVEIPNDGSGDVIATATAWDDEGRGVAVAVAVAGVPTQDSLDNEMEMEMEDDFYASVTVTIQTDSLNMFLIKATEINSTNNNNNNHGSMSDSLEMELGIDSLDTGFTELEAEAEAEAEAEVAYGVAAASAAASTSGYGSKTNTVAKTVTSKPDYVCTEYSEVRWVGDDSGNWYESQDNWSDGRYPEFCSDVVVPTGVSLRIEAGKSATIHTLTVESGATIIQSPGAQINVTEPE